MPWLAGNLPLALNGGYGEWHIWILHEKLKKNEQKKYQSLSKVSKNPQNESLSQDWVTGFGLDLALRHWELIEKI